MQFLDKIFGLMFIYLLKNIIGKKWNIECANTNLNYFLHSFESNDRIDLKSIMKTTEINNRIITINDKLKLCLVIVFDL